MDTTPRHGDSDNILLKKIAASVAGAVAPPATIVAPVLDANGVSRFIATPSETSVVAPDGEKRFQATFNSDDDGETNLLDAAGTVRLRLGRDVGAVGPTELFDSFAQSRFAATSDGGGAGETKISNANQPVTLVSGVLVQKTFIVSGLPSAATVGAGARSFVTDASTTLPLSLGLTVIGLGTNKVPVYSDGTNWKVG